MSSRMALTPENLARELEWLKKMEPAALHESGYCVRSPRKRPRSAAPGTSGVPLRRFIVQHMAASEASGRDPSLLSPGTGTGTCSPGGSVDTSPTSATPPRPSSASSFTRSSGPSWAGTALRGGHGGDGRVGALSSYSTVGRLSPADRHFIKDMIKSDLCNSSGMDPRSHRWF
mmetsp:Transcript_59950/g.138497  ORF Transcript_59950/g.138497 Transcript_59950/m.138497 type:complete len:173 (+) Transcript_59950:41-559(+)